ncbi:hypothetical protein VNO77_43719 [Canavalia gladiata]|uniref:Uncharacterized protein n=1 Tax=Canavalia gladiata TaxID=3824 RepID=A0AAN9PQ50_CANGL
MEHPFSREEINHHLPFQKLATNLCPLDTAVDAVLTFDAIHKSLVCDLIHGDSANNVSDLSNLKGGGEEGEGKKSFSSDHLIFSKVTVLLLFLS